MYQLVPLPEGGFQDGHDSHILVSLAVEPHRQLHSYRLSVRGRGYKKYGPLSHQWQPFGYAGGLTLTLDRARLEHDLQIMCSPDNPELDGPLRQLPELLVLALDEHAPALMARLQDLLLGEQLLK